MYKNILPQFLQWSMQHASPKHSFYESYFQMTGETKEATMLEKQISSIFLKR